MIVNFFTSAKIFVFIYSDAPKRLEKIFQELCTFYQFEMSAIKKLVVEIEKSVSEFVEIFSPRECRGPSAEVIFKRGNIS